MSTVWERFLGVIGSFFQVGGPSGPGLNDNAGALEAKDPTNTTYVNLRGADPVVANDLVTLEYFNAHASPTTTRVYGVSQTFTTTLNGPVQMSQFPFDPSVYPTTGRTIFLKIVFFCSSVSDTCTVVLTNVTDALTVATLTTSLTTPDFQTAILAVPANLPNSLKQYALTVQRSGGVASDSVTIDNCYFEVFY